MPEISLAEDAAGWSVSRQDPCTKLLALLVLNALVMRAVIAFWFARFFAGFGLALYVYRTMRIGQMKAALRAVRLLRGARFLVGSAA